MAQFVYLLRNLKTYWTKVSEIWETYFLVHKAGGESRGTLGTTPEAYEVTAAVSVEEYGAGGKVEDAVEVVDEVWLLALCLNVGLKRKMSWLILACAAFSGRYEYSHIFRDSRSSDGAVQVPTDFGTNMVYYYDDGNKVQMYTVDEKLLKEYIKRQMWVFSDCPLPFFFLNCVLL